MSSYIQNIRNEFNNYHKEDLIKDVISGISVGAISIPLSIAFGVSSGVDGATGLLTALLAGFIVGSLGGGYVISGPTGAMAAVLINVGISHGLPGVLLSCFLCGVLLLIASLLKLGKIVSFIPSNIVLGFTGGIAIQIFTLQLNNFFGITTTGQNAFMKILSVFNQSQYSLYAIGIGVISIICMLIYPKKFAKIIPAPLGVIIIMLCVTQLFHIDIPTVGYISATIIPSVRLSLFSVNFNQVFELLIPSLSLAVLVMIQTLLCSVSGAKQKECDATIHKDLFSQAIANMIIPFFGGITTTGAIARTNMGIQTHGKTRIVSFVQSITIIVAIVLFGPFLAQIPLAALSGVLIVISFRMNNWEQIKRLFQQKVKTPIAQFLVTVISTLFFDLTISIMLGLFISVILFVLNNISLDMEVRDVRTEELSFHVNHYKDIKVIYVSGPMFFGNQGQLTRCMKPLLKDHSYIILSMRGVPTIDDSAVDELRDCLKLCIHDDVTLYLTGLQKNVKKQLSRLQLDHDYVCWDVIEALENINNS